MFFSLCGAVAVQRQACSGPAVHEVSEQLCSDIHAVLPPGADHHQVAAPFQRLAQVVIGAPVCAGPSTVVREIFWLSEDPIDDVDESIRSICAQNGWSLSLFIGRSGVVLEGGFLGRTGEMVAMVDTHYRI
ncbi:unnamed protein product [Prorocentrum cordatum]|uniref:Uncharacterized protein n=1 Tax=Prorocentrum cordatum TaxID=2364126 RepID=A0ABN9RJ06_9DINO|nr:unnamed protein product [Polarella glacialis]